MQRDSIWQNFVDCKVLKKMTIIWSFAMKGVLGPSSRMASTQGCCGDRVAHATAGNSGRRVLPRVCCSNFNRHQAHLGAKRADSQGPTPLKCPRLASDPNCSDAGYP